MAEHKQIKVTSLSEYIDAVAALDATLIRNGAEKNEELLFRGHSDIEYELLPSLGRNRSGACSITIFNEERNLIEMAKSRLPDVFRNDMLPLELLALLQHHGIPTRLLDVTENALVALYFACSENEDKEGEVLAFKHNDQDVSSYPIVQAIADSYRLVRGTFCNLEFFYQAALNQPYFLEHKHVCEICHTTEKSAVNWVEECCKEPQFVYAPIRSIRQQVQRGRYILFPNKITDGDIGKCFNSVIEAIPKTAPMLAGTIEIPKESKKRLLAELALCGISRDTLFCDSVDVVCAGIVEKFNRKYGYNQEAK